MNNDLISREALKKAIDDAYKEYDGYAPEDLSRFAERVDEEIDNAPTVENITIFCENADEKTIEDLKVELERVKTELRPQGEWKDYSEDGYVECPICNCLTNCDDNIDELHYCWNCGAKLRKGGAE